MSTLAAARQELAPAHGAPSAPECVLLAGSASARLGAAVAAELGTALAPSTTERFPDGELSVTLGESVRGREVVLVQSTSPPVNDHLVELLAFADACRRAAAARVIAIVPYFGYARADRRQGRRVAVMARLVADLMQTAGIDHVVGVDVHTAAAEGFFRVPVDTLSAVPALCEALRPLVPPDAVVVAPDLGAVRLANEYARLLGVGMAACHKHRRSGSEVEIGRITGEVAGRRCVLVDDMISTGATIAESIRALLAAGALPGFTIAATHGVLMEGARERLVSAGVERLLVSDSIDGVDGTEPPTTIVSIASMLAAAVRRLVHGEPSHARG